MEHFEKTPSNQPSEPTFEQLVQGLELEKPSLMEQRQRLEEIQQAQAANRAAIGITEYLFKSGPSTIDIQHSVLQYDRRRVFTDTSIQTIPYLGLRALNNLTKQPVVFPVVYFPEAKYYGAHGFSEEHCNAVLAQFQQLKQLRHQLLPNLADDLIHIRVDPLE